MSNKNLLRIIIIGISLSVFIGLLFFVDFDKNLDLDQIKDNLYVYESSVDNQLVKFTISGDESSLEEYVLVQDKYLFNIELHQYEGETEINNGMLEVPYLYEKYGEEFEVKISEEELVFSFSGDEKMIFISTTEKEWEEKLNRFKYRLKTINEQLEDVEEVEAIEAIEEAKELESELDSINNQILTDLTDIETITKKIDKHYEEIKEIQEMMLGEIQFANCDEEYAPYCDIKLLLEYAKELVIEGDEKLDTVHSEIETMKEKNNQLLVEKETNQLSNIVIYEDKYFEVIKEDVKAIEKEFKDAKEKIEKMKHIYD